MSAEQTPDIEAAIAEELHGHALVRLADRKTMWCVCLRWSADRTLDRAADERSYEAHVAEALAPVLAAAVREAKAEWERQVLERCVATMPATGEAPDFLLAISTAMLATRADRVAVDAPEGGEGR